MLDFFGIDQKAISNAIKNLPELEKKIERNMDCIKDELTSIRRVLSSEFGAAVKDHDGYDPRKLPGIEIYTVASGQTEVADMNALLNKPVSRGHIKHAPSSAGTALLKFGVRRTVGGTEFTFTKQYPLAVGEAIDISWFLEAVEITANGGNVELVIFVQ
jgi:hypothetical protein